MDLIAVFGLSGTIIFLGFFGEYIFEKTNIPDALWLILFGLIIRYFFDFSQIKAFDELGLIFTTFALIFILFEGVLKVDIKEVFSGLAEGTSVFLIHFFLTMIVTALAMMIVGWDFLHGLLLGAIIGDSAQAVIVPLMKKIRIKAETALVLTFESAISDIFCIVGAITLVNVIVLKSITLPIVVQKIIYTFLLGILAGVFFGLLWVKILPYLNRFSRSYMTTIAALVLLYSIVEYFGASGALACLAFGIVVGNIKEIFSAFNKQTNYDMESSARFFYSQISFFLKTFFFVYVGTLIDLKQMPLIALGFLLALLIFLIRPISVAVSFKNRLDIKEQTYLEIFNPKGLSAVVLAQLPLQYGIKYGEQFSTIVLSVVVSSILITIVALFLTERGYFRGIRTFIRKKDTVNPATN